MGMYVVASAELRLNVHLEECNAPGWSLDEHITDDCTRMLPPPQLPQHCPSESHHQ